MALALATVAGDEVRTQRLRAQGYGVAKKVSRGLGEISAKNAGDEDRTQDLQHSTMSLNQELLLGIVELPTYINPFT